MKQEGGKKLMEAMRQVLDGKIFVSDKISAKILEIFSGNRPDFAAQPVQCLTDREFEVFQFIGKGLNVRAIGEKPPGAAILRSIFWGNPTKTKFANR